ncbi:MAG: polysaccharide pyruvyl transferase family protein [Oscillospiraceae bacterium]
MKPVNIAITAACFSGNKGAAAMLQSSIKQLRERYGERLHILLMSTYPKADERLIAESPEKYDFIEVVDTKPEKLLFIAFPLAILYSFLRFIPPLGKLLRKNKILNAYSRTDLVIDEAGISFVDSRGFVMNTYAFVCAAVPMLCAKPVVKYSQALGSFRNPWNRFLAKWILPKIKLICARGSITQKHLADIGITENVRLCADGAFSMPDSEFYTRKVESLCDNDDFFNDNVIALSISSVVQNKCSKMGVDYQGIMTRFIERLCGNGYHVLLIANAAREGSAKPRNNDLIICGDVYEALGDKTNVRWYPREMSPEEIRELIGRSRALVASRFHAMIGALAKGTPTLLIGWSHKYKEVLDMFGLGEYAVDFSELSLDALWDKFLSFIAEEQNIRLKINAALPEVLESSRDNIRFISEFINEA